MSTEAFHQAMAELAQANDAFAALLERVHREGRVVPGQDVCALYELNEKAKRARDRAAYAAGFELVLSGER